MASEVDIANRALSKLGESRITSMTDDNKAARAMNARFEYLRDAELMAYPWRFAVKRVQLSALTTAPEWGYSTIYEVPSDNIKIIRVGGAAVSDAAIGVMYESSGYSTSEEAPYEIIEGKIHTNLSAPLDYEYIYRVTDTGQFDPLFVEALACRLAADAAEELTQAAGKQDRAERQYFRTISEARRTNAIMRPPRRRSAGRWMAARVARG